jgi:hypothetical protein
MELPYPGQPGPVIGPAGAADFPSFPTLRVFVSDQP